MNEALIVYSFIFFLGALIGVVLTTFYRSYKKRGLKEIALELLTKAESQSLNRIKEAELQVQKIQLDHQKSLESSFQNERKKLKKEEERLDEQKEKIDSRLHLLEKKLSLIEKKEAGLLGKEADLESEKNRVKELKNSLEKALSNTSCLTSTEAKEELFNLFETEIAQETAMLIKKRLKEAEETADQEASKIIALAIQRLATPCAQETTINTVPIPGDDMKGRIIGREGRNIRALEMATGVSFVIDDTPGAVVLSSFDPLRLYTAKLALLDLISDGRIHPTKIEEAVDKAQALAAKQIKAHGQDAALRAGCPDLHPEVLILLGKLKLRYSLGQNVLDHSIEVSHLMGMMAEELGLNARLARRIGLLHDIGKAVSHEVSGTHALIGRDLALKFGESASVANGIGCHHFEIEAETIEASLCSSADAISASRPGARVEALEEYFKRLRQLEEIAKSYEGVEKAYAMQAGKELRVIVEPSKIDDAETLLLARKLTKQVEKELSYPGKIKVTVIREKRAVEYAL